MRDLRELDRFRVDARQTHGWSGDETCGAFKLPSPIDRAALLCIASSEGGSATGAAPHQGTRDRVASRSPVRQQLGELCETCFTGELV